jgi:hypothetical protein
MGRKKKSEQLVSDSSPDPKPPDKSNDYESEDDGIQAVTTSLKKIVKNEEITKEITKYVNLFHIVTSDTYFFIRAFLLHYHKTYNEFCKIDQKFVERCISIVTVKDNRGRKAEETDLIKEMKEFYKKYQKETGHKPVSVEGVSYGLKYLAIDIITAIKNNVKIHFCKRLSKFINYFAYQLYKDNVEQDEKETDKEYTTKMNKEVYKLRKAVFEYEFDSVPKIFDDLFSIVRKYALPPNINSSVSDYLSNRWSDFLPCMFNIIHIYEQINTNLDNEIIETKDEDEKKDLQKQKIKLSNAYHYEKRIDQNL